MLKIVLVLVFSLILSIQAASIQIKTLKAGEGPEAGPGRRVKVHYTGWLTDSTRFDSSRDRGEPLEFMLGAGQVIDGWEKGISGMKIGELRRLVIPAEMGYGNRAVGPIPANSTLVFEVELLGVEKGLDPDVLTAQWKSKAWKSMVPGLDYFDEAPGNGPEAVSGSTVSVHHTGWLAGGGTRFASSKPENKPIDAVLGAGKLIRGWEYGLMGAKKGMVRWLRIQPALGYGTTAMARIPPNSELLYRIEVLDVETDESASESMDLFPDISKQIWTEGREGLKIVVLKEGQGEPAQVGQKVQVHYTGWTQDGDKFDSSRDRNQLFTFPLGAARVIRGWDLGVEGMLPGEKRLLLIPPGLGYGSRGAGPIPADATLVFAVEYLGVAP